MNRTLKREANEDLQESKTSSKRWHTISLDENQTTNNQGGMSEQTMKDSEEVAVFTSPVRGDDEVTTKTKCPPVELLCRLFPTQKPSVLQLIYQGCNQDLIKTIECVLPSHEKSMAGIRYHSMTTNVPVSSQFIPHTFPPFFSYPMKQQHRLCIPPVSMAESLPLCSIHEGSTFMRGYFGNRGFHSEAKCQEFNEEMVLVSQRVCPGCRKNISLALRVCNFCGHNVDLSSPHRE